MLQPLALLQAGLLQLLQPLALLQAGLLQPLLPLLDRASHWEPPSPRQDEYVVVETAVVRELPSLALLEAVSASDPSVGDPRPWMQHHRLGASSTEVCQALALLAWQPTLSHDAVPPPLVP